MFSSLQPSNWDCSRSSSFETVRCSHPPNNVMSFLILLSLKYVVRGQLYYFYSVLSPHLSSACHLFCEVPVISGWVCFVVESERVTSGSWGKKPVWKQSLFLQFHLAMLVMQKLQCKNRVYGSQQQNVCGRCVWIKLVLSKDTIVWGLRLTCRITRACVPRCQVFEVERCDDTLIQPRVFSS